MTRHLQYGAIAAALLAAAAWAARAKAEPAAGTGQIRVVTQPPEASVLCNGQPCDVSPVTVDRLPAGDHLIVARKQDHVEARRTVTLQPGQKALAEFTLTPVRGLALVHSTPDDAALELDGVSHGKTPALLTDLSLGRHRLRISKAGNLPKEVEVEIRDRTPQKVDVVLESDSAQLVVVTKPDGATVSVNGIARGTTPCTVDRIPTGVSQIKVTLAGYAPYAETVRLTRGESRKMEFALTALPGVLNVVTVPEKARIYVDDQFKGESPVQVEKLEPGVHRIRAELRGYEVASRDIEIKQGAPATEEFRLTRNSGILELITEPAGVQVFVDGDDMGVTQAKDQDTDVVSEPFRVDLLRTGKHELQLSRKGYSPLRVEFTVERDKTATLTQRLERRFVPDTMVSAGDKPSDIYRGVLSRKWPNGNIELELAPGVFKTFIAAEVKWTRPIQTDESKNVEKPPPAPQR